MLINNVSRFSLLFIACCILVAFSSCAKYKPGTLSITHTNNQTRGDVTAGARALTETECFATFSRRILKKGYQPIQLLVANDTDQTYILHAHNIELELESSKIVADKLHLNTSGRIVSWGAPVLLGSPIFLIPAIVEGIWSTEANKKLDTDFIERTISHDTTLQISPHSLINRVMFVLKDKVPANFEVTLINKKTPQQLVFTLKPF